MEENKESLLSGYSNIISYEKMKKIIQQMERGVCKFNIGNNQGTGFFCQIPFPNKNNMLPVFITSNHLINKNLLYKNDTIIKLDIEEENELKILELNNRMKYTNEEYDTTIIELKEDDNFNLNYFLELDEIIIKNILNDVNQNKKYINETLYMIQYPENKLSISFGILNQIYKNKEYNFNHKCSTKKGSLGSPILTTNNKLIAIQKEGKDNNNIGTFLNYPIKEFIKLNYNKVNSPFENNDKKNNKIIPNKIDIFKENSLYEQKILIVMLWSCSLSEQENKLVDPKYIEKPNKNNVKSISNSVEYLGVKVKTVLNYEDAIKELTTKDKNGKCNYFTVWLMCGPETNKLPDNSPYSELVNQFIDCLLLYWENGGSVVLFCSGDPLYFQANLFLEKIKFKKGKEKTKLRIIGNDPGGKELIIYNAEGNSLKQCTYDSSLIRLPNGIGRFPIGGRNLPQIYEGQNISHANSNKKEDIKPFIPFAKNSSGNVSIMIYYTQGKEGDIIIDCGYKRFFLNMNNYDISTWRYLQNLTCFLIRPEVHLIYDNIKDPKNYRPNGIDFNINYNILKNELDIVYMIDSTCSMQGWINVVKNNCIKFFNSLKENKILKNFDIQFGGVFYRDPVYSIADYHEYQPLGNVYDLKKKMDCIQGTGGGDQPEDWIGAYEIALTWMNWRKDSIKIIIHIADAGAHHFRFSEEDGRYNDDKYEIDLVNSIKKCANNKINILGY